MDCTREMWRFSVSHTLCHHFMHAHSRVNYAAGLQTTSDDEDDDDDSVWSLLAACVACRLGPPPRR